MQRKKIAKQEQLLREQEKDNTFTPAIKNYYPMKTLGAGSIANVNNARREHDQQQFGNTMTTTMEH